MRLHSVKLVVYLLDTAKGSIAPFAAVAADAFAITIQHVDLVGQGSVELVDAGPAKLHPVVIWHAPPPPFPAQSLALPLLLDLLPFCLLLR